MARRLCDGKPAEWWETGDPGTRLALLLCRVCPHQATCRDPQPYGVIIAGTAYNDYGMALPVCHCGYPHVNYRGGEVGCCVRCSVHALPGTPKRLGDWIRHRRARLARASTREATA